MSLMTRLSHFDVKEVARTETNVIFSGTLAGCRKLAFSHGMEVEKYEGRTISFDSRGAVKAPADANNFSACWFKGAGLLMKGRDDYSLVMPLAVWANG